MKTSPDHSSPGTIRLIDDNDDGIVTVKEIKAFTPCDEYEGKRINREFREFGRRVDINDFSQAITPKQGTSFI